MDINTQLAVLSRIYSIYEDFINNFEMACEKYCSLCCTRNVTLTTLEGHMIVDHLLSHKKTDLFRKIKAALSNERFQPTITTNRLAELCGKGEDFFDEENKSLWGNCPLLIDNACPIYPVRPFGCKCLVSRQKCQETGYADMDSFVISANHLFLQTIEHIDSRGFSGNLIDVLHFLESEDNRKNYTKNTLTHPDMGLISNQPIKVLMIPPEHRIQIQPIVNALQNIKVPIQQI